MRSCNWSCQAVLTLKLRSNVRAGPRSWSGALLCGALLLLGRVPMGGTERASEFQRLVGTWRMPLAGAGRFVMKGTDVTEALNQRYESVRIDFFSGEAGDRSYQLAAARNGDSLRVQGADGAPRERTEHDGGLGRPVVWTFDFGELRNSVEFLNPPVQGSGSRAFLETLLPNRAWGDAQCVQLRLLRESPPTDESGL